MYASMLPSLLNMKTENLTNSGYDDGFLLEENILQMMGELNRTYDMYICTYVGWYYRDLN